MKNSQPIVDVVLYLRGQSLDPSQVSLMLGTNGSLSRLRGDKWRTSTNREVTAKIGLWTLVAKVDSPSLSDKISWLKGELSSATCSPLQIPGVQEAEVDVYIELGSDDEGNGEYETDLTAQDLAWLSSFGVSLSISLSYITPENQSRKPANPRP